MSLGIETFAPPQKVEFDPTNKEHVLALAILQFHGRQHPTIRFKIDPKNHANAYVAMLDIYLHHVIPKEIIDEAAAYDKERQQFLVGKLIDGSDRIMMLCKAEKPNDQN